MNPVLIELAVSTQTSRLIGIDDAAQLFIEGRKIEQRGKVYQKSTVADPATRTFAVKVITRNLRLPVDEPSDPAVLELPRVRTAMPVIRLDPRDDGPLFVEERSLGNDEDGPFVWSADGLVANRNLDPDDPTFVVRKVRVTLGERRMNFQKVFMFRELEDPRNPRVLRTSARSECRSRVGDGERVALIHETWQLNPGDLVTVRVGQAQGSPGFYVPMEAIAVDVDGVTSVFVVGLRAVGEIARRVTVEVGESVGNRSADRRRGPRAGDADRSARCRLPSGR